MATKLVHQFYYYAITPVSNSLLQFVAMHVRYSLRRVLFYFGDPPTFRVDWRAKIYLRILSSVWLVTVRMNSVGGWLMFWEMVVWKNSMEIQHRGQFSGFGLEFKDRIQSCSVSRHYFSKSQSPSRLGTLKSRKMGMSRLWNYFSIQICRKNPISRLPYNVQSLI